MGREGTSLGGKERSSTGGYRGCVGDRPRWRVEWPRDGNTIDKETKLASLPSEQKEMRKEGDENILTLLSEQSIFFRGEISSSFKVGDGTVVHWLVAPSFPVGRLTILGAAAIT